MPTTITRTIGSGRDHSSISDWFSWCTSNYASGLVAADVILRGELYDEGGGTDGEWTVSSSPAAAGLTCDATRYYLLEAATGKSFYDDAGKLTNALRYNRANGVAVSVTGNYTTLIDATSASSVVVVRGLQIKSQAFFCVGNVAGLVLFDRCVLQNSRAGAVFEQNAAGVNCLIIATDASGCVQGSNTGNRYWRNCTIWGAGAANAFAYGNYAGGNVVANCAIFGFAGIVTNSARLTTAASINIATDLASVGWTGGSGAHLTSLTASAQFENVGSGTEDFRVKTGSDLEGAGARDQTYTADLDIIGQARGTTTPTIGAWEFLVPAPDYTYLRPTSDISNTGWTPSTPGDLYPMLDETTSNRTDYISANGPGAVTTLGYTPTINQPTAGSDITIRFDAQGMSATEQIRIELLEGANVRYNSGALALGAAAEVTLTMTPAQWATVASWPWTIGVRVTTL